MSTTHQYPIGKFHRPESFDPSRIEGFIDTIEAFPGKLNAVIGRMTEVQLQTPYREGGWTVKQVVHHCADSHMNSFIRFKLGMTETTPTIKPYEEAAWASMPDYTDADVQLSLQILTGLHGRWTILLRSMHENDFQRTVFHPQQNREMSLFILLALYAWHCEHHLAHVMLVKDNSE